MHGPLRVEDVELAAVRLRGDRDRRDRYERRLGVERRVDREPRRRADDHTVARERQRARSAERQLDRLELRVARRLGERHDHKRCGGHHDRVVALDGDGRCGIAEIRAVTRTSATARPDSDDAVTRHIRAGAIAGDGESRRTIRWHALPPDDSIVAEREDPERHDLLREVWVGPLVGLALREKLERRPCVIHLVEVHVAGPVQPVAS